MTTEDILLLDTPLLRQLTEENIGRDPNAVALDKRIAHAGLVATQVKYLQRARRKLPSYYEARAILPPLAFEQSSSEAAATRKSWRGDVCIDLTCGLGVDSFHLSRRFARVIAVERDAALARAAEINFRRLGADNITVVCTAAEEFRQGRPDIRRPRPPLRRRAQTGTTGRLQSGHPATAASAEATFQTDSRQTFAAFRRGRMFPSLRNRV